MCRSNRILLAALVLVCTLGGASTVTGKEHEDDRRRRAQARLGGFQEVPVVLTTGHGRFVARLADGGIRWELSYRELEGAVAQAHIHLGQQGVNGGIAVFLCTNLGNGPAGTQACPPSPATISGMIESDDVREVAAQGLGAGELRRLLLAMRAGLTYVNVHSDPFLSGEIRGQIRHRRRGRD